jgi:hypothetical protein
MIALALALTLGSVVPAPELARSTETLLIRVTVAEHDLPRLLRLDLDVAGVDGKAKTVDVIGDRGVYDTLRAYGFAAVIERDLSTVELANPLAAYSDPAETNAAIDALVSAYPALAKKVPYAVTEQGRSLFALEISDNVAVEEDEPAVFFVAQHHAREVMTPEIALDIATRLLSGYGTDPAITAWVDTREIFVLPSHNPDGTFHVFDRDKTWRKNRRNNGDGTFGVDLNRNYPFHWNGCGGSSGDTGSDGFRGPGPASEPETAGITALAQAQRPVISLSYHTYGEQVLIPYGCPGVHAAERAVFRRLSSDVAARLVSDNGEHWYQPGAPWEILYGEDGETNAWFYGENGTYALEIEANASSQGFLPSYNVWRDSTVTRSRPGWEYVLDRLDGPGVSGHVTDACTGAPLAASIALDEVTFTNGEAPRTSEPLYGRFQWLTNGGTVHLRAGKPGYADQVWQLDVDLARVDRPVRLVPAGAFGVAVDQTSIDDPTGDGDGEADPGEAIVLRLSAINTGAAAVNGLTAAVTTADPYVTITDASSSYGTLAAGARSAGEGFGVSIAPGTPDEHVASLHVSFSASESLCAHDEDVTLRITKGRVGCRVIENLDVDPGWTITNSTSLGWAFGPPAGDGAGGGPAAAYSGLNVYGTNLSGPYGNNADDRLTTTAYDAGSLRHAVLSYERWLDNEAGVDRASVDISTDGGATWVPLDAGFGYGEGWEAQAIDISSTADGRHDVRFRFRLTSDVLDVRSGFYVDDVRVCGEDLTRRPNGVGGSVRVTRIGSDLRLDWSAPAADATHDAATGYRVYASGAPAGGFAAAASGNTTFALLAGEAGTPAARYYLVVAENFGGASSDVPLP